MEIEESIPLLEELLGRWKNELGKDYPSYRNHVYRMIHFCFALQECDEDARQKIIIAGCFHDLGIWTKSTMDYLPPSIDLAMEYLHANDLTPWTTEIERMIDLHHKLRAVEDERYPLVEVFRRADLVDVSLGLVTWGLPRALIKNVKAQFPNAGFHKRLMQLAGGWFSGHPLSPPPFMKW